MGRHRCTEAECPHLGQRTDKGCGCHKTDERVLIEQRDELLEALEKAEAAIARITEGDGGMTVDTVWRKDGARSKHDRCPHGRWMYEGCETCADAILDPVLDGVIRPAIAKARGEA